MAPPLLLVEAFSAVALGVASHVLLFVHGELDDYTISITQTFITALVLTIILISVQVNSILLGIVVGSLLFSLYQFALGASILVYRVFLHRLSPFPTARPYVLSKWFAARYAAQTGRYFANVKRFHERHGDFVRTGNASSMLVITLLFSATH
jgi:cytochrome P450 family 628